MKAGDRSPVKGVRAKPAVPPLQKSRFVATTRATNNSFVQTASSACLSSPRVVSYKWYVAKRQQGKVGEEKGLTSRGEVE